jgi:hypothetical protein
MGSGKYRALFPSTSGQRLQIENTVGSCVSQVGSGTMQIIRECRMRATILTGIAKDAPELENQLLYVAEEWLALAALREQLNIGADRAAHKLPAPN